jgi:hypothetical protein
VKIVSIEGPIMCGIILCMDENGGESSFEWGLGIGTKLYPPFHQDFVSKYFIKIIFICKYPSSLYIIFSYIFTQSV